MSAKKYQQQIIKIERLKNCLTYFWSKGDRSIGRKYINEYEFNGILQHPTF